MEITHLTDLKVPKAILISRSQQKTNTSWNNFKAIKYLGGDDKASFNTRDIDSAYDMGTNQQFQRSAPIHVCSNIGVLECSALSKAHSAPFEWIKCEH